MVTALSLEALHTRIEPILDNAVGIVTATVAEAGIVTHHSPHFLTKAYDGISVTTTGYAVRAGNSSETSIYDDHTGTHLIRDKQWVVTLGSFTDYAAKTNEIGDTIDTTYEAKINSGGVVLAIARGGRVTVDPNEHSSVDIVRRNKLGEIVYRHTTKSTRFASAVGHRAASKLVKRIS